MQVESNAECPKGSILQYYRPSLSYHLSLRYLFCLFLIGHLRQVYCIAIKRSSEHLLDCTGDGLPVPLLFVCDRIRG